MDYLEELIAHATLRLGSDNGPELIPNALTDTEEVLSLFSSASHLGQVSIDTDGSGIDNHTH